MRARASDMKNLRQDLAAIILVHLVAASDRNLSPLEHKSNGKDDAIPESYKFDRNRGKRACEEAARNEKKMTRNNLLTYL